MAGDWIKMRTDLAEDPAVIGMAEALSVDEDMIVGKLHRLWCWADRQSRDGHATGVTQIWIDRYIRCDGFAQSMVSVGWLEIASTGITFPNFDRHNGETAKTRALGSKRKQKQRSNVTQHVHETSRNERDKSVTREEKRREEKKEQQLLPSGQPDDLLTEPGKASAVDLKPKQSERLAAVAADAIAAYNAALAKPEGLLPRVKPTVGKETRQSEVRRSIRIAREICSDQFGSPTITREFWDSYFGACNEDAWLRGEGPYTGAHANWKPDFEYLTRPATVLKVFERATQEDAA